jgi:Transposase, Mutator family
VSSGRPVGYGPTNRTIGIAEPLRARSSQRAAARDGRRKFYLRNPSPACDWAVDGTQATSLALHSLPHGRLAPAGGTTPKGGSTWLRRRTDVGASSPARHALIRLVGAVLAEQHDEWTEMRRYIGLEVLAHGRLRLVDDTDTDHQEATPARLTA